MQDQDKRPFRLFWAALAALLVVSAPQAQNRPEAETLTPQQIRLLEQLPPSEREALLRNMGITPEEAARQGLEFPDIVVPPDELEAAEDEEEDEEPRLEPGSSLILKLTLPLDIEPEDLREREQLLEEDLRLAELEGTGTYRLDRAGVLYIPGVARMSLAGLTVEEAAARIVAEDPLSLFEAEVLLLPLLPQGAEALEPFGYELFEGVPLTFAPATDVPVPADYVVGPGDELRVQLFGSQNTDLRLVVSRDGTINFPEIGPISVANQRFEDVRVLIATQVVEQMIGVRASVTLGELRSIRVFVLGDVRRPGSFTVSGLSTMTNALFVSGGILRSGTLRDVQLKRAGRVVARLDLYDLLLAGDSSDDARLLPGDVIFVPPVGAVVGVAGEVRRPAYYELRGEGSAASVISMAGGLEPDAFAGDIRLERIRSDGRRTVETVDLRTEIGAGTLVGNGDILYVNPIMDDVDGGVRLSGHVHRPGAYGWSPGMRITDLIPSKGYLKQGADLGYALIRREEGPGGPVSVVSADLAAAFMDRGGMADIPLQPRDSVIVFDLETDRTADLEPVLADLRRQARAGLPSEEVGVGGMVRQPGTYPLEPGMRISDLVRAGADLAESAYALEAELTRYRVESGYRRVTQLIDVDLGALLAGDETADLLLQPFDFLNIKEISLWREQGTVELRGEVQFPGIYPIELGETLSSVLARAGGLTDFAFVDGSVFLREELKEREREQLDRLALRLENDLAALSLQAARADADLGQSLSVGQSLLSQLRGTDPLGRLVIDLRQVVAPEPTQDVILKNGDVLVVPEQTQEVTVIGEVQYSTSHIYDQTLDRDDYIGLSGGLTANADNKRIYVVRANGAVQAGRGGSKWFRQTDRRGIRPGDTIVVPLDVDRVPRLALWQSSTTIIYNLAIAAAAVGSL